jgi:hypothetical protein
MARTKQQARDSVGGKAPRKQLATKAVRKAPYYSIRPKVITVDLTSDDSTLAVDKSECVF